MSVVSAHDVVVAPADRSAVGADAASVVDAGADRDEQAFRRRSLPFVVHSPAGKRPVGLDAAVVVRSGAQGSKEHRGRRFRPDRRPRGLGPAIIQPPAGEGPVNAHSTGIVRSGTHVDEWSTRRRGLSVLVTAPTDGFAVGGDAASVETPSAYDREVARRRC